MTTPSPPETSMRTSESDSVMSVTCVPRRSVPPADSMTSAIVRQTAV
ncbi:hypothetical protein [Mobilicoccus caccae]|nr:hypothetical protein [Mobilicoccus caccae]